MPVYGKCFAQSFVFSTVKFYDTIKASITSVIIFLWQKEKMREKKSKSRRRARRSNTKSTIMVDFVIVEMGRGISLG
jgi:hypothetical protein